MRCLSCRRALGLPLMDWTSECSTTPSVNSGPAKRLHLSSEMLARAREGCSYRTKCTKSKGLELHESVVCRYMLSTSSLLGSVPQEVTFGVSSVDFYSAHPLVNLEKNLFHIIGGTLDE